MTRHRYNAESWTNPDGTIDFGASVPFGAQVRHRIAVEKRTGYHVQCYRDGYRLMPLGNWDYEGESAVDAMKAFSKTKRSQYFRYITLTDLSTNTIIQDHSTKDTQTP